MSVGRALFAAGRYAEALAEFEATRAIDPAPEMDLSIARCYDALGQAQPALQYYITFVRAAPDSAHAPAARARIKALKVRSPRRAGLVKERANEAEAENADGGDDSDGDGGGERGRRGPRRHPVRFSMAAKPSLGFIVATASGTSAIAVTYGVVGELSFNFYATRAKRP